MLEKNIIFKQKYEGCIQNVLRNSSKTFFLTLLFGYFQSTKYIEWFCYEMCEGIKNYVKYKKI